MEKDLDQIYQMIRITLILNKFVYPDDKIIRHIVWIPIDTSRDFEYKFIKNCNSCARPLKELNQTFLNT